MSTDIPLPNYALDYDEELDAICSLELLAEHLPKVITVPHHWKWVILALHNSMQGFMVLSLQGTHSLNVLEKKSAKDWSEGYETGKLPKTAAKLDDFMGLYAKIQSDLMHLWTNSKSFAPGPTQNKSVQRLNAFRNDFVHYVPAGSLYDLRAWTKIVIEVVPIIEFLAFESRNITFQREEHRERVVGLCLMAKNEASALLKYYGA
jgi:hypothetical protein